MTIHLTPKQAIERLQRFCKEAGGPAKFAKHLGVTTSLISHMLHGRQPIHGRVAKHIGIKIHREVTISYKKL